jgi:hypothetical protein
LAGRVLPKIVYQVSAANRVTAAKATALPRGDADASVKGARAAEEDGQRVEVHRVAEDYRTQAALSDERLGLEVIAHHGILGGLDVAQPAAGEAEQPDARDPRGIDHVLVLPYPLLELARRDQQDAGDSLHRAGEPASP